MAFEIGLPLNIPAAFKKKKKKKKKKKTANLNCTSLNCLKSCCDHESCETILSSFSNQRDSIIPK